MGVVNVPRDDLMKCACCGVKISPEVPDYYIELECFRMISEQGPAPRRGSREYHDAMERLVPEIRAAYFQNRDMYDRGHLWCPNCGSRLSFEQEIGDL